MSHDGEDSQMYSSASSSPTSSSDQPPITTTTTHNPAPTLSPPSSQQDDLDPPPRPSPSPRAGANSNGKRPLHTLSGEYDAQPPPPTSSTAAKTRAAGAGGTSAPNSAVPGLMSPGAASGVATGMMTGGQKAADNVTLPVQTHAGSGYTWTLEEDRPGFAWLNKKAVDEAKVAAEGVVHVPFAIKDRYGDPFEAVEREAAIKASLVGR